MAKSLSLCGAETKARGTCRNQVGKPGERCHRHPGHPLGARQILSLCFRVVEVISALGGAAAAFEQAYPTIVALWGPVRGPLMPEYFWDRGFEPKDPRRMRQEAKAARAKRSALRERYLHYTDEQKLAAERAYRGMLRELKAVEYGPRHIPARPIMRHDLEGSPAMTSRLGGCCGARTSGRERQ